MIEFTGERVIPGGVSDDLWAEHASRYAFASTFAGGKQVLDIGCGTGYGTAELSHKARRVVGFDIAGEAVSYARSHYPLANASFAQASATCLPFATRSFDLAVAFEVIEHLSDWRSLLSEVRRVLHTDGIFVVSTPNRLYYADSRAHHGPNPFHVHEFEFAEFRDAMDEFFPRVSILLQNRMESFAFYPEQPVFPHPEARIDGTRGSAAEAHFFIAVCGTNALPEPRTFVYVPRASNLLREREQHIRLLDAELSQTKQWLANVMEELQQLLELHATQTRQLEDHNRWALQLEKDWKAGLERITQLQEELKSEQSAAAKVVAEYENKVTELQGENLRRTQWALETEARLTAAVTAKCEELAEAVRLLDAAEGTVIERTHWAQQLESQLNRLEAQFRMLRQSRWLKLGRVVGLGPRVEG
ncbi:MAG: methyltransferase domain-containing protein [Bryobacteraceae bacterium]